MNDVTYMYRFGPDNKVPKTSGRDNATITFLKRCENAFIIFIETKKKLTFDALSRLRRIETHFNVVLTGMTQ